MTVHQYLDPLMDAEVMIADLLNPVGPRPPAEPGVYVVTDPMAPIYVGKTRQRGGLRDRIGDLVACSIGLYGPYWGKELHSGGRTIRKTHPPEMVTSLHVAWRANPGCIECAEHELWRELGPQANTKAVSKCKLHEPAIRLTERQSDDRDR